MPIAQQHGMRVETAASKTPALQNVQEQFRLFAHKAAITAGSPWAFTAGVAVVALWAVSGQWFGYSEEWQLVINTGTTIITFLMVFIIQNTQARDSREMHLKLDELLRAVEAARDGMIRSDDLTDEELDRLRAELHAVAVRAGDGVGDDTRVTRGSRREILRQWLRRPPERRTAAHIREFHRSLESQNPDLLNFPTGTDTLKELSKILSKHVTTT